MKKKRITGIFIILLLSFFFLFSFPVQADSGWNNSYDSYDSSSYSDYDVSSSDSSSSGGRSRGSIGSHVGIPGLIAAVCVAVVAVIRSKKKKGGGFIPEDNDKAEDAIIRNGVERENDSIELLDTNFDMVIQKYLPDSSEEELLEEFYRLFVEIQNAWMEFDYETLEKDCSHSLYEAYKSDLEALKEKHGQNIMSDFTCISSAIRGIEEKDRKVVVDVYLKVSFKDYVVNTDTSEVIRGEKDKLFENQYDLEFIMDLDGTEVCPSCRAPLTSKVCDSCHSIVHNKKDTFVLNQKGIMGK